MHEEVNERSKKLIYVEQSSDDSTKKRYQDSDSFENFTIFHQCFRVDEDFITEKCTFVMMGIQFLFFFLFVSLWVNGRLRSSVDFRRH